MMKMIDCYTSGQNCIRVICTSKPFSQDNQNLFNKEFIDVFKTIISIPEINKVIYLLIKICNFLYLIY